MIEENALAKILKQGVDAWSEWRRNNPSIELDLSKVDLVRAELAGVDLNNADLREADLSNANLKGSNLNSANATRTNFSGARLTSAKLNNTILHEANFSEAILSEADLTSADLLNADLRNAVLISTHINRANLRGAKLRGANLTNAHFSDADLAGADFSGANLSGTDLRNADLRGANLSGATLNERTQLLGAISDDCTIDRYQLERLADYGGLTIGNRMTMNIIDGVAQLRASYSGFWQWIHLTALAMFVFPYVWFVVVQWSRAKFVGPDTEAHMPLWEALLTFIYNGGIDWQIGPAFHWSFIAFLFLTLYNFLRAILLWKTKQLELHQESSGLPAMFSLEGSRWGVILKVANWSFSLYLVIALFNTGHFFTQEIPVNRAEVNIESTVDGELR